VYAEHAHCTLYKAEFLPAIFEFVHSMTAFLHRPMKVAKHNVALASIHIRLEVHTYGCL